MAPAASGKPLQNMVYGMLTRIRNFSTAISLQLMAAGGCWNAVTRVPPNLPPKSEQKNDPANYRQPSFEIRHPDAVGRRRRRAGARRVELMESAGLGQADCRRRGS